MLTRGSWRDNASGVLGLLPENWLERCDQSAPILSNQPALEVPFQRWFKFKEAFSPQFIVDCIDSMEKFPGTCLDPFGGSGTTALTCQLMGVRPTTIEVNPFLADLISSKLTSYDLDALKRDYLKVLKVSAKMEVDPAALLRKAPDTLVEPGRDSRWIYSWGVAARILAIREAISFVSSESHRAVLSVALGSILVPMSNVVVNGKGRKYRRGWETREKLGVDVDRGFRDAFVTVYTDLVRFASVGRTEFTVLCGDSRQIIARCEPVDLVVFSPPYPNSFDYTDIYNLELWMLGYLSSRADNTALRNRTMRSHVQVKRDFSAEYIESQALKRAYRQLCRRREELWDDDIPEMVLAYFADMKSVLKGVRSRLNRGGRAFLAVGNSKYAGVVIDTAKILREMAPLVGFKSCRTESVRSMRASAQQGGRIELQESLMVLG
jgi:DNA modification methylase